MTSVYTEADIHAMKAGQYQPFTWTDDGKRHIHLNQPRFCAPILLDIWLPHQWRNVHACMAVEIGCRALNG